METEKDWINDVFASLDGIKRPVVDADLFYKIQNRLVTKKPKVIAISARQLIRIAACAVLLVGLNAYTCLRYNKLNASTKQEQNSFSNEYFSYMKNVQL